MTASPRRRSPEEVVMNALRAGMRVTIDGYELAMGVDPDTGDDLDEPVFVAKVYSDEGLTAMLAGDETAEYSERALTCEPGVFVHMCRSLPKDELVGISMDTVLNQMARERAEKRERAVSERANAAKRLTHLP